MMTLIVVMLESYVIQGSHNCFSEDLNVRYSGSKTGSLLKLKVYSDLF